MSDDRDAIRSRIDIVDLVSQRVQLKRAGRHFKGLCPFHEDRNPSFTVSPETGYYKCWSCGESGDIFTWVMKTQNVEFGEALKQLAEQAGVTLSRQAEEKGPSRSQRIAIMEEALRFFRAELEKSKVAREYLENRALPNETIDEWELGYAPSSDSELAGHLKRKGFLLSEAAPLFLIEDDGTGGYYDKFRGRLMFPIRDERGDLVAFGGRIIGDGQPKYINSGDTPLFRKSKVLYGLLRAKEGLAKTKTAVLVEGYLDVIACHRAGIVTALASLGTSLAEDHAKLLKRWCEEVVVLYDADAAGEKAAARACEILQAADLKVRVALMPPGEDPDTLLRKAGSAAVVSAASAGLTPLEFRLMRIEQSLDPNSDEFWKEAITAMAEASSWPQIERQAARMATRYLGGSREGKVAGLMEQVRTEKRTRQKQRKVAAQAVVSLPNTLQTITQAEAIVLRAFLSEELRSQAIDGLKSGPFSSPWGRQIAEAIVVAFPTAPVGPPVDWLIQVGNEAIRVFLAELLLAVPSRELISMRQSISSQELQDALLQLELDRSQQQVAEIREKAADEGDIQRAFETMKSVWEKTKARWT